MFHFFWSVLVKNDNTVSLKFDSGAFVISNFNNSFLSLGESCHSQILIIPVMNDFRSLLFIEGFQDCDHQFVEIRNAYFYCCCTLKSYWLEIDQYRKGCQGFCSKLALSQGFLNCRYHKNHSNSVLRILN